MRLILLSVFLLISHAWQGSAYAKELGLPYFESIPGSSEIANGIITAVAQDHQGLLWLGTPEGLYSYDGYRFRPFNLHSDEERTIADDYVRALLSSKDGRLWIATQSAGVSIFDPKSGRFEHFQNDPDDPFSLGGNAPISLTESADGTVWIGFGGSGMDRWDPLSGRFEHFRHAADDPGSLSHDTVRSLLVDHRGDLWVGTGDGLQRLRSGSSTLERIASDPARSQSLAGQYIYALYQAEDQRLWIGTQADGAAVLELEGLSLRRIPPGDDRPTGDGLGHAWVDGFCEVGPQRMWITTFGGGIDVLEQDELRVIQRLRADPAIPSLALDRVIAPLKDRSGLIWIGSWGAGLQRHNPINANALRTLRHSPSREDGLSHGSVLSALEIAPGRVWVGTGGNGIDILDLRLGVVGGYRPDPKAPGALRDGTIRALAAGADGQIWVGTQQAGLHRYDPNSDRFEVIELAIPDSRIRRLLSSANGPLFIGTQAGLASLDPATKQVQMLDFGSGKSFSDAVWSLLEDQQGNLWVGTPNALWLRRAGQSALSSTPISGLGLRAIMDLRLDGQGVVWAAGPGGLARLTDWQGDQPRFAAFQAPTAEALFGRQLLFDKDGRIWTPRQLIDVGNATVHGLGPADGVDIDNVQVGGALALSTGELLFGGTRGLLMIDPERYLPWQFQAPMLLGGVEIDGRPLPLPAALPLLLQPGQQRLAVEFAALDYSAPELTNYAYQLRGLDRDWIPTDASHRIASYNNLWPGDYQLLLRAKGRGGQWGSDELSIPIKVMPAWWQTLWALFGVLLLLIGTIYLGTVLRTARIRRRASRLSALIELRTAELSQAKDQAEQALRELKGTQQQLVAAEKMAALGQLVAGVAHEINTPIGIAVTAASHLEDVGRHVGQRITTGALTRNEMLDWQRQSEAAMRLILASLDRASTLVASFKQVSVDQSSEQSRRFRLDDCLRDMQDSLAPSLRRTPHTLEVDCPLGIDMETYPGALFQILSNLVNNAVLHAFSDGRSGLMRLQAEAIDDEVELGFSDDGCGMDEQTRARAFDPFFTTRRGAGGSGLGLHLVHNLTTGVLGGRVELSSAPGCGTTVRIRLPTRAPQLSNLSADWGGDKRAR